MNYSFRFIVPESKKLSNGQNHLYLRFTANRKTSIFKLPQFEFLAEHWNNEKQLFYRTNPNYLQYTKLLSNYSLKASEIINKYVLESKNLTLEDFKKHFFNENFGNQDFFIFVESIIKNNVTFRPATIDGYISELNKLRSFKKQVFFNNIDMKFLNDYQIFMTKINNCANTQNKTFRFLRQIINKAIDENLLTENI